MRLTAIGLILLLILPAGSALAQSTADDEKTITIPLAPPFPDNGFVGSGCPAALPDGTTALRWSDFFQTWPGGRPGHIFVFKDTLPANSKLKSIDATIVGMASDEGRVINVYLNKNLFTCSSMPDLSGTGLLLGTFTPQVGPFLVDGHCGRVFQTYTASGAYDSDAAAKLCATYQRNANNQIAFLGDIAFEYSSATLTLHYTSSDYTATGQIVDGSAEESKSVPPNNSIYAQVPLGLELTLGIKNSKGDYIPAEYRPSPAQLQGVADKTLYPTNAALEYGRTVHEGQKTFRGVHIGQQTVSVIPDDTKLPTFTLTIGVFDPGNLGNNDVQYDPQLVIWGNKRGIPPHILKGLIRKEGPFNPTEYRYEPLNGDTGDIGVTLENNMLGNTPYSHYRMETATKLARGDMQVDEDVTPRNILQLPRGDNGQEIGIRPTDICPAACVSAKEIVLNNDDSQNWTDYAAFDINDPSDLAKIDFTAQTPLAASYGLMQEMYVVAAELNWKTTDGRQNPSLLFDTKANTDIGGGSVAVGTLEFYKRYRACRSGDFATDPDFKDSDDYKSMMIDALNYYNHGNKNTNLTYGSDAWNYAQTFSPSHPLSKIFP